MNHSFLFAFSFSLHTKTAEATRLSAESSCLNEEEAATVLRAAAEPTAEQRLVAEKNSAGWVTLREAAVNQDVY